ncbi:14739_t:CDS:1, partial [Cetraspora pellucida]
MTKRDNNNIFISGANKLIDNYAIEGTACWASQVEENELFETNKENISFSVQNETRTNTKKPTNTLQINVKQQSNYGPNNSPNHVLENNKPKHVLANNSKEPGHVLRHSVQKQEN